MWILLFSGVTLFEYNVSTILSLIVGRSPFQLGLIFVSHVKGSQSLESKCLNSWLIKGTIVLDGALLGVNAVAHLDYHKIPKISPRAYICQRPFLRGLFLEGLIFGGAYLQRGLSTEGNLCFKIDWASLIAGSKFTVFALFYFVFEGNFPSTSPLGAYIWRGDLTEGFLCNRFGGIIFGGAYTRRGLFSEFYSMCCTFIFIFS